MQRLWDIWSWLLGRKRIPRTPDELRDYCDEKGREVGELESRSGRASSPISGLPPAYLAVIAVVTARIANLTRPKRKRSHRHRAAAKRHEARAGSGSNGEAVDETLIDFFASRVVTYLVVYGLTIGLLEATGMLTSSIAFETALGEVRVPMSIAAGAILVLASHVAGHLIHAAKDDRSARRDYLIGAAIVLAAGALAVVWMGVGREANSEAVERFGEAGTLRTEASRLDLRADRLLRPLPKVPVDEEVVEPSAADRRAADGLYGDADRLRREAGQIEADAREERTLSFLIAVQLLGLAVGTGGGYLFASAAPIRKRRKELRHRVKADVRNAKADGIDVEINSIESEERGWGLFCVAHYEQCRLVARGSAGEAHPDIDEADLRRRVAEALRSSNGHGDPGRVANPTEGQ